MSEAGGKTATTGYAIDGTAFAGKPIEPGLYPVATPIGNLSDISLRALEVLAGADLIVCEDSRVTAVLLDRYGIRKPLAIYHEHNAARERPRLLAMLRGGMRLALVSDAGTPLISDPGYRLVHACIERGLEIDVLPGPSVVPVALVASGLPTDRWRFEGFLPKRSGEMERVLRSTETVIAFESPRRIGASLAALAAIAPERQAAVCREMTKLHEEVTRGTLSELALRYKSEPKGEIVLVIGPAESAQHGADMAFAVEALKRLVQSGARPRAAATVVAALTGTKANDLYKALTGREARR